MFLDNLEDVKKYCTDIICYYSDNDPYVKYEVEKDFADTIADKEYCISTGYMSTGVHVAKSQIDENEIQNIPEELGYRFILNKVWHQKD